MTQYKRNQIEEAISRVFEERSPKPSSELRTRLKRLLEMDRSLGRNARSANPEMANYAFYSSDSPGKGVEVWFSVYEAFALLTALKLLDHGWPQSLPVSVMRRVRPQLERQHARILKQDPAALFDEEQIRQNARASDLYVGNTDPVFLAIVTGKARAERDSAGVPNCGVCRGMEEVATFLRQQVARSWTLLELVGPAHSFSGHLKNSLPHKRGRGG